MDKCKRFFRVLSVSLLALSIPLFSTIAYYDQALPDIYRTDHQDFTISSEPSISAASIHAEDTGTFVSRSQSNTDTLDLKLFGLFPVKAITVQTTSTVMLSPCGTAFGIKMFTNGVLVVGMSNLETDKGSINPAKDAGLEIGDILCTLDGQSVNTNEDVARIISASGGKKVECVYKRGDETKTTWLTPQKSRAGNSYRIGIWVRDSSAGIGTLTYCDFDTQTFAGLGHGVCDVDTGKLMPLMSGEIVSVTINDVVKGIPGKPGELRGVFHENMKLGDLTANTEMGVFGNLLAGSNDPYEIPMAFRQEISEGNAQIMTTIDGDVPQLFDIVIEKITFSQDNPTKNMVIRITDPTLLEKTGGIVQGMSGSPIIQNGKLIGAVTHVFVNDPTKGYAIFAENMYYHS